MSGGAIRGSRIGSGPMGENERGEAVPRRSVTYFCVNRHETPLSFAMAVEPPETWDCPRCGMPASQDDQNPPTAPRVEPYKTHLAYVKERRSDSEAEEILTEALTSLRSRRKRGDVIY